MLFFRPRLEYSYFLADSSGLKYSFDYYKIIEKIVSVEQCIEVSSLHCLVCRLVPCYFVTTPLRLVLFYCFTTEDGLPLRKRRNMPSFFTLISLIVFYRSSISKNVFRKKVPASGIFLHNIKISEF